MSAVSPLVPLSRLCGDHVARGLKLLLEAHGRADPDRLLDGLDPAAELQAVAAQLEVSVVIAAWDELASFELPVLALGARETFLIADVAGNIAHVQYPLLGELTLLRSWVEERWSGEIAFFGPAALRWAGHVG